MQCHCHELCCHLGFWKITRVTTLPMKVPDISVTKQGLWTNNCTMHVLSYATRAVPGFLFFLQFLPVWDRLAEKRVTKQELPTIWECGRFEARTICLQNKSRSRSFFPHFTRHVISSGRGVSCEDRGMKTCMLGWNGRRQILRFTTRVGSCMVPSKFMGTCQGIFFCAHAGLGVGGNGKWAGCCNRREWFDAFNVRLIGWKRCFLPKKNCANTCVIHCCLNALITTAILAQVHHTTAFKLNLFWKEGEGHQLRAHRMWHVDMLTGFAMLSLEGSCPSYNFSIFLWDGQPMSGGQALASFPPVMSNFAVSFNYPSWHPNAKKGIGASPFRWFWILQHSAPEYSTTWIASV